MLSPLSSRLSIARYSTLLGYFGLLSLILVWNVWIQPSTHYPIALVLIILLSPLLCALRGLLHGRSYTHAWVSMLSLGYFVLGVSDAYSDPVSRGYGWGLIGLSLLLFTGCIFFVRLSGKAKSA